jgi:hypothetical protein
MRPRIQSKMDIREYIQEEKRRQRVYGLVVKYTSDECDLCWSDAKNQVNKNLKQQTLWHLLKNC